MCGVVGIFSLSGKKITNAQERINRMTDQLHHRGPDSQGTYVSSDGFVALGNTRLAIVDPHTRVQQPMVSADGNTVLSFNGEIYNFHDLRRELESKGVRFKSNTDTEVLLEGLQVYGEEMLQKLDGMWSFAHYDISQRRLLISRDLLGERHMFYKISKDELIFSSEMIPILSESQDRDFEIDFDSFLTSMQYFTAPPTRSMVKGIHRIQPAHNLVATVGGQPKIFRYRRLHPEKWFQFFDKNPTLDESIAVFEETYYAACKRRLPEEVPYISTLSGGIDSTLTCIYASDFGKKSINTLYGQSSEKPPQKLATDLDELTASDLTAKKFGTNHMHIFLNSGESVPVLKALSENAFDGMFDSGVASFEMLARHARKMNNKVMLIADGPDEMLGGYIIDQKAYQVDLIRKNDPSKFKSLVLSPFVSYDPFHFIPVHSSWSPDEMRGILSWDQIASSAKHYGNFDPTYNDLLPHLDYAQMRALSYASYTLPDMFNLRVDKAYMRASVEARLPYQAPDMIELMIAMPTWLRFNEGNDTKYILRKIVEKHVGPQLSTRSKHGFSAPIWKSPIATKELNYAETVADSSVFDDFEFNSGARDLILKPESFDMLWPFYVLARTQAKLKTYGRTR